MKKLILTIIIILFMFLPTFKSLTISANDLDNQDDSRKIIYLDLIGCEVCDAIKDYGVLEGLEEQGVDITVYDVMQDPLKADQYASIYNISGGRAAPIIFAGDNYYRGADEIKEAFDNGDIYYHSQYDLRDISEYEPRDFSFLGGLVFIILTGLLDGINPCAIAMLLMFITMIGFTKSTKIMLTVSLSYIISVFIAYFFIGLGFLTFLSVSRGIFDNLSLVLYSFFSILTLFLAGITFYDYLMTRNQKYENVKNQLPRFIRRFNERLMEKMTAILEEKQGSKQFFWFVIIPSFIGILVGITEAACTGQIYVAVLASLEANMQPGIDVIKVFYLFVFNLMFILPLIIIAIVAIKSKNTMVIANFMREHLSKIKLATALFFLFMAVYFVLLIMDVGFINFEITL